MGTKQNEQRLKFTAGAEAAGQRLDIWLHGQLPARSRAFLQKLIRDGCVQIQNPKSKIQNPKPNHPVQPGDVVEVVIPPPSPSEVAPEAIPLDVLYEDADLIVVNKPPGLVVHPAAGHRAHTLVNALLHHCRGQLSGIGGVERPGIVHRLDGDTSGCLVAAKRDRAHRDLQEQFKARTVAKHYLALVWGVPRRNSGFIEGAIGRSASDRKKMRVVSHGGREAITEFEVIKPLGEVTLLRCTLHTGRTHQIRVHLAAMGHPIVGDKVYGGTRKHPLAKQAGRQMLHAQTLAFDHPRTHKRLEFAAPLPQDMAALIRQLESCKRDAKRSA
ncbi:MAG: RluA family pseudouridine synthase [Verrucomicrobia bacterium]|nr:RluA family pseudouridine synthase [Verrucomicrobiota bacterium]